MATGQLARTDDTAAVLQIIATVTATEDAVTKHWQGIYIADGATPSQRLTVDSTGRAAVQIAAAAASIAKAEDVASADADVGVPAMAIQKASPANTAGTDGDYSMLQMSAGRLWASATIDAALPAGTNVIGHFIVDSGTITTLTGITNVVHVDDNASSLTVDWAGTAPPIGAGVEATALRVTLATDSTGQVKLAAGSAVVGHVLIDAGTAVIGHVITDSGSVTAATLGAETTKVIGVVRTADGSGNLLTSTASALDVNIKSGGGTGGTSSADKSAFTLSSGLGTPAMGVVDEVSPLSYAEETVGVLRMSPNRNLYGTIRDSGGNERGANVDSTLGLVTSPSSFHTESDSRILRELRCIRLAIVSMVTEAGSSRPEDFDPALIDQFDNQDLSIAI